MAQITSKDKMTMLSAKSLLNHLSYFVKDEDRKILDQYHTLCRKLCSWGKPLERDKEEIKPSLRIRLFAIENGICTRCLSNESSEGKRTCAKCLKYKAMNKRKVGLVKREEYIPRRGKDDN